MSDGFSLRSYQIKALDAIDHDLRNEKEVLLSAIMGAGKTVMTARLINKYWKTTERRFLVLAHKKELVEQFENTFQRFTDIPSFGIGVICAGLNRKELNGRLTIGTVQTFANLANEYQGADLLVVDECHNVDINNGSQYAEVIRILRSKVPSMRILGITATPFRLGHGFIFGDKCRPKSKNLFPRLNHRITYEELKTAGHLVPLKGKVAHADSLTEDLKEVQVNGDYVLNQLGDVMTREIHMETAREAILEHCQSFKRVCVFCVTIDHAEKLRDLLNQDEPCTTVHSQLSSIERYGNLEGWKSGRYRICTSINILAEGFDFPPLDCLVFVRPTVSARLYLQAVGRVLRTAPGKEFGFLMDLTDNTARFGTDLDSVRVDIPKAAIKEFEEKNKLWKLCPMCSKECHKAVRICPECGHEFYVPEVLEAESVPEMHDIEFAKKPPVIVDVVDMETAVHHSKNDKFLGRVMLYYDDYGLFVSVWFCFEDFYSGYAVQKGRERWEEFTDAPYPIDIEDFQELRHELRRPARMELDMSGKYPEILRLIFEEDPIPAEEFFDNEPPEDDEDDLIPF
jgi:DNA repair protein RadD